MRHRGPSRPKSEGHNWLRIELPEGGRYVDIPLRAVN